MSHQTEDSEETQRANRVAVTITPLRPRVIYDLEQIVLRFGAEANKGPGSEAALMFDRFRELWTLMDFGAIFQTQRACGRVPALAETREEYVTLLLAAVARHLQPTYHAGFAERLGALFLLFTMHLLQPSEPRVPVPVAEDDWAAFEQLAEELRARRHADGFKVLHALWSGEGSRLNQPAGEPSSRPRASALKHTKCPTVILSDVTAFKEAKDQAALLAVRLGLYAAVSGDAALRMESFLGRQSRLESDYEHAWRTTLVSCGADEGIPSPFCSEELRHTLKRITAERATAVEHAQMAEREVAIVLDELHERRQAIRQRLPRVRGQGRGQGRGRGPGKSSAGSAARTARNSSQPSRGSSTKEPKPAPKRGRGRPPRSSAAPAASSSASAPS